MARFAAIFALLAVAKFASASPVGGGVIPLIVGGVEAQRGEFPFMVDIRRSGGHYCGANLVNSEWVMTAAHCTQGAVNLYTLVAGDHDINVIEGTEQNRTVVRIVNHPQYSPGTYVNDISLMKVSHPFELNSRVRPAALPPRGFPPTVNTVAAGWGRTTEGGSSSPKLLKVTVPYVDDATCNLSYNGRIHESMICAGLKEGGKDACQGDSGGPLMCHRDGTNYVCGIVSWGTGCARPNFPGVYTETSYFTDWVEATIRAN